MGEGLNTGTTAAVPPALTLKPHSQFLPVCLRHRPSFCPFPGAQGECLQAESVHRPFRRTPGIPAAFRLTHMDEIPTDFHSQMFTPLPGPSAQGWGGQCGAVTSGS